MERIRAYLTQRLGPLPIWAWALIALIVIGGYLYFSKSGLLSGAPAPSTNTPSSNPLSDLLAGGGIGGGSPAAGGVPTAPTATSSDQSINQGSYFGTYAGMSNYSGGLASGGGNIAGPDIATTITPGSLVAVQGPLAPGFRDQPQSVQGGFGSAAARASNTTGLVAALQQYITPQATSAPALNQYNPVSAYGRGN